MTIPPHVCKNCNDTGGTVGPAPAGQSWFHPCPCCYHLRQDVGYVVKLYKRQKSLPGIDGESAEDWLRWHHSRIANEVLSICESERQTAVAVQLALF